MNPKDIISKIGSDADQGIIYHYSKWPAMLDIVRTTKNNIPCDPYLSIRAYNASFMNDEDECKIGYQSFLDELRNRNVYFGKALSEIPIEQIQKKIIKGQQRYYLSSFAKSKDCLPMWRTYGGDGNGIAIGLDSSIIVASGYSLYDCIYDKSFVDSISKELCDWAENVTKEELGDSSVLSYNECLYLLSAIVKNHHFSYEQECRLCFYFEYFINKNKASFNNGNYSFDIHFEARDKTIVSYINIELPIDAIKEIWIGPTNNISSAMSSIEMWLNSMKLYNSVSVHISSAPYKG